MVHQTFVGSRVVRVLVGDLALVGHGFIVCPANSYGTMRGGVAGVILARGGKIIEEEAMQLAPIPLGSAVLTTAGSLACEGVIHAPTMRNPIERATTTNVRKAVRAVLRVCGDRELGHVTFPGMGTGTGVMSFDESADAMISEIETYTRYIHPDQVDLVAVEGTLATAWVDRIAVRQGE